MALKQILDSVAAFAGNVAQSGLDLAAVPIRLLRTMPMDLVDDFNDGVLHERWVRTKTPAGFVAWTPMVSPNGRGLTTSSPRVAQTFQLGSSRKITGISWLLDQDVWASGQLVCEIQSVTGLPGISDVPTGTVLATSNARDATTVPGLAFPPPAAMTQFYFPADTPTLPPGSYAFVLRATSPTNAIKVFGEASGGSSYFNGRGLYFDNATSTWLPAGSGSPVIHDFYFHVNVDGTPGGPVETGGSLQFDYPVVFFPDTPLDTLYETVCNVDGDSFELSTVVRWDAVNPSGHVDVDHGSLFSIAVLLGPASASIAKLPLDDAYFSGQLVCEVRVWPDPENNDLSFHPVVAGADGTTYKYVPSGGGVWQVLGGLQAGFFNAPPGQAGGIPFTVKVTPQPGGGVQVKVFKNNDPAQVIVQSSTSPVVRGHNTGSKYHVVIAHTRTVFESRYRFDELRFSGTLVEAATGHVTFRRQFAQPTKVQGFKFTRTLPAVGEAINVRTRTGDTLAEMQAAAFSAPHPTTVAGSVEIAATPSVPAAKFIEYQLEFVRASPSPQLSSFDLDTVDAAVADDLPVIFLLDLAGPGAVTISTTEGESETANTNKLKDSDPTTQYASTNATDGTEVGVIFVLSPAPQDVNSVLLRNTNLKGVRVECPVGTAVFDGELTTDDELVTFPNVATTSVKVVGKSTKTPNQTKRIGEVYIGRPQLVLPGFDDYEPKRRLFESGDMRTLGGKLVAFRGKDKYVSRWTVRLLDRASKDELERLFRQNPFVTFWPEPGFRPRDLFDVGWKLEELPFAYTDVLKPAGHTLECEMEEI